MLSNHNNNHNSYDDYHRAPHFVAWLIVVCHANFSARAEMAFSVFSPRRCEGWVSHCYIQHGFFKCSGLTILHTVSSTIASYENV